MFVLWFSLTVFYVHPSNPLACMVKTSLCMVKLCACAVKIHPLIKMSSTICSGDVACGRSFCTLQQTVEHSECATSDSKSDAAHSANCARFSGGGKPAPHSNPSMPIECHSAWVGKEVLENSRPLVGQYDGLFGCAKNDSVWGSTLLPSHCT